jgi:hypothetical protein
VANRGGSPPLAQLQPAVSQTGVSSIQVRSVNFTSAEAMREYILVRCKFDEAAKRYGEVGTPELRATCWAEMCDLKATLDALYFGKAVETLAVKPPTTQDRLEHPPVGTAKKRLGKARTRLTRLLGGVGQ